VPFKEIFIGEMVDAIIAGKLEFPEKNWKNLTNLSKDFIKRLLKPNVKTRLSAKQALNHPWLFVAETKKFEEKSFENLSFFNHKKPSIKTGFFSFFEI